MGRVIEPDVSLRWNSHSQYLRVLTNRFSFVFFSNYRTKIRNECIRQQIFFQRFNERNAEMKKSSALHVKIERKKKKFVHAVWRLNFINLFVQRYFLYHFTTFEKRCCLGFLLFFFLDRSKIHFKATKIQKLFHLFSRKYFHFDCILNEWSQAVLMCTSIYFCMKSMVCDSGGERERMGMEGGKKKN